MCQCRFILGNKCTPVVRNIDNEDYAYIGTEDIWEISVLYSQFCHKPKTALKKIKSFKKISYMYDVFHNNQFLIIKKRWLTITNAVDTSKIGGLRTDPLVAQRPQQEQF